MRNDVVAPFIPTGSGESANFKNKLENEHPPKDPKFAQENKPR